MYNSSYSITSTAVDSGSLSSETAATIIIVTIIIVLISVAIGYVLSSYLLSRIFKKAGIKQSIAWIPVYNTWKLLEMGDQKGFWAPLAFVPGVNIASAIFLYIAMYHIGRKFGKEDWFIALAIFVAPVWFIILAFDKSKWNGGGIANPNVNQNTNPIPAYTPPVQNIESPPSPVAPIINPAAQALAAEQPTDSTNQQ